MKKKEEKDFLGKREKEILMFVGVLISLFTLIGLGCWIYVKYFIKF